MPERIEQLGPFIVSGVGAKHPTPGWVEVRLGIETIFRQKIIKCGAECCVAQLTECRRPARISLLGLEHRSTLRGTAGDAAKRP